MIFDNSVTFELTDKDKYKMKFKYTAETDLMCSIFTFVEESFNVQSYTTENMESSKEHGFEKHVTLGVGKERVLEVPDIKVATGQPYVFAEHLVNNYYPLIIRLVSPVNLTPGKQTHCRQSKQGGYCHIPLLHIQETWG